MALYPLKKFEIQNYYQNEPKFNGVHSRNNLLKIKYGTHVINLDEYESIGTYWIALYLNDNNTRTCYDTIYFDSFGVEHIPKEIKNLVENKNTITNNYRIQAYNLIMYRYFCIGCTDFILKGKSLLDYKNLFSPHDFEKNDEIIVKYFSITKKIKI